MPAGAGRSERMRARARRGASAGRIPERFRSPAGERAGGTGRPGWNPGKPRRDVRRPAVRRGLDPGQQRPRGRQPDQRQRRDPRRPRAVQRTGLAASAAQRVRSARRVLHPRRRNARRAALSARVHEGRGARAPGRAAHAACAAPLLEGRHAARGEVLPPAARGQLSGWPERGRRAAEGLHRVRRLRQRLQRRREEHADDELSARGVPQRGGDLHRGERDRGATEARRWPGVH